jgi:VanZ family protein
VLGALVTFAVGLGWSRAPLFAVVFSTAYALTDEFHQAFVPGRVPDPVDLVVDVAGATVGAGVAWWIMKKAARRRPS